MSERDDIEALQRSVEAQIAARREGRAAPKPSQAPLVLEQEWISPDIETWWLPPPIQEWCVAVSQLYQVPAIMPVAAALCTMAAIVQGRCGARMHNGPLEQLSLYWIVFAPTGARKSAVMGLATAPLRTYQHHLEKACKPEAEQARRTMKRLETELGRLYRQRDPGKHTPEGKGRAEDISRVETELSKLSIPNWPLLLVSDINPPLLPKVMRRNLDATGIARVSVLDAEGTFLQNMLGRHTGHIGVETLLKASTGEAIELVRASNVTDDPYEAVLPHSHLTLCVMAQPHILELLKEHPVLSDSGFMGRLLASSVPECPDVDWEAQGVPERIQQAYSDCLLKLCTAKLPPEIELRTLVKWSDLHRRIPKQGTPGWHARVLGRLGRIEALCELAEGVLAGEYRSSAPDDAWAGEFEEGDCRTVGTVSGGAAGTELGMRAGAHQARIDRVQYLFNYFILSDVKGIRMLETPTVGTTRLAHRLHRWLRGQFDSSDSGASPKVGTVTLREVQRALSCSKDQALTAADELVAAGVLKQCDQVLRRNRTVTVTYMVCDPPKQDAPNPNGAANIYAEMDRPIRKRA